jgi:2-amino-4-hydroxy-6-hydroxymethyldihydropteridine diphosphokinase
MAGKRAAINNGAFDATLGLGSNIGDKVGNIARAIALLTADGAIKLVRKSRDYNSPPWGILEQESFVNACIAVATKLSPHDVLKRCQKVETEMGRVRHQKWGPRIIDVDILTYRAEELNDPDLVIPHPFIASRAFVLLPLLEIAPDLTIEGVRLTNLIASADINGVTPLPGAQQKHRDP